MMQSKTRNRFGIKNSGHFHSLALAPLRTLRLCGESLHALKAALCFRERCGGCLRSAGITCRVARKRAPTPSGSHGWLRSVCGRGALALLRWIRTFF